MTMLTFGLERHQDFVDALNGHRRAGRLGAAQAMCFGADMSHWQGPIDFAKVKASGLSFVVIKATEGTGYVDPMFRAYRAQARAAGLIVLMYGYAGSSVAKVVYDATAEANHFITAVWPLAAGEGAALDFEPAQPPPNPPAWSRTWLDRVASQLSVSPWEYMNSSTEARYDWTGAGVPARYGLWLAKYDNDPDMDPVVHWPSLAAEQYWDRATVPGVAGPVDVDVFYGTREQLLAYCKGGTPTPQPGGFLMALDDAKQDQLYEWLKKLAQDLAPISRYVLGPDGEPVIDPATSQPETYATPLNQELGNIGDVLGHAYDGPGDDIGTKVKAIASGVAELTAGPQPVDPGSAATTAAALLAGLPPDVVTELRRLLAAPSAT